jgi:3-hydroxyisobutyrate dehydrogenase
MKVGYIGLGAMGGALARRLLAAESITVWDLNQSAVNQFAAEGANTVSTPVEIAQQCDIIFLSLPKTADVRTVLFGSNGLAQSMRAGSVIVDQTSGTPDETCLIAEQLNAQGIAMIDAPVSGTPSAALAGGCTIMVSGPQQSVEAVRPYLKRLSERIIPCGERVGFAQAMKLMNNALNNGCRLASLEIMAVGKKKGLSLDAQTRFVNSAAGCNKPSLLMFPSLVQGKKSTNFALKHVLKDINQSVEIGRNVRVSMPVASMVRGVVQIGANTLGDAAELEDIVALTEKLSICEIPDRNFPRLDSIQIQRSAHDGCKALRLSESTGLLPVRASSDTGNRDRLLAALRTYNIVYVDTENIDFLLDESLFKNKEKYPFRGKTLIVNAVSDVPNISKLTDRLTEAGMQLLDVLPIHEQRDTTAPSDQTSLMVGGDINACAAAWTFLLTLCDRPTYCGPSGSAHLLKTIDSVIATCNRLITHEAMSVSLTYGLSMQDIANVINSSSGWSRTGETLLQNALTSQEQPPLVDDDGLRQFETFMQVAVDSGASILVTNGVFSELQASIANGGNHNTTRMASKPISTR